MSEIATRITAHRVTGNSRMAFLPRHFNVTMGMVAEALLYRNMRNLCPDYLGGSWEFFDLSNGGMYMAPSIEKMMTLHSPNGFSETVSADAAGITASLYMLSNLAGMDVGNEKIVDLYHSLRSYAAEQPEWAEIANLID